MLVTFNSISSLVVAILEKAVSTEIFVTLLSISVRIILLCYVYWLFLLVNYHLHMMYAQQRVRWVVCAVHGVAIACAYNTLFFHLADRSCRAIADICSLSTTSNTWEILENVSVATILPITAQCATAHFAILHTQHIAQNIGGNKIWWI